MKMQLKIDAKKRVWAPAQPGMHSEVSLNFPWVHGWIFIQEMPTEMCAVLAISPARLSRPPESDSTLLWSLWLVLRGGGVISLPPTTGPLDGEETSTCVLPTSPSSCLRPGQEWPSGRGLPTMCARKSAGLIPPNQEPSQSVCPKSPLSPAPVVWVVTGSWGIMAAAR